MKMKRYKAPSMMAAMNKIRDDFGDNAVIVSSDVVYSKGILGMFKKKSVEVVAGYDVVEKAPISVKEPKPVQKVEGEMTADLKKELADLKQIVQNLQVPMEGKEYPDSIKPIMNYLEAQGISQELTSLIGKELVDVTKKKNIDLHEADQIEIASKIVEQALTEHPFGGITFHKKFINVLGPTGVGKTTTIAKMAARTMLEKKKKVGFITTDTYRIAAFEQLKTYANLLQAPVEIAYNADDFEKAITKLTEVDIVFIDTAGRNYKEVKFVQDLRKLIDFERDMENYLVLSLTSKESDMVSIIEQFESFPIEKFIFTKIDETNSIGSILNLMIKYKKGLAYYTDGQEVPEDITEATVENLLKLLFEKKRHA